MHPNELLARREIDLINAGDFDALDDLYADDLILHYPGRNPLSGFHRNVGEFLTKAESVFKNGTLTRELHDALGTDDHAVQLLRVTASVGGTPIPGAPSSCITCGTRNSWKLGFTWTISTL